MLLLGEERKVSTHHFWPPIIIITPLDHQVQVLQPRPMSLARFESCSSEIDARQSGVVSYSCSVVKGVMLKKVALGITSGFPHEMKQQARTIAIEKRTLHRTKEKKP
ncbi:unnamed protein product [Sphenostylis stenocarpa]|uniref:Uncharacterized protein n=1 Tax=Sphenostylis stenocarpa TaxID=92480 RepID=A0AA86VLS9_9FABA|nr:unnamed protein product [Sphenostylis stenocarpa]